ncbi:MAG: PD-(D/E)XK nuclease family protein, partial [Clostridia bacterium]|nr:PD-(D/E)XK nuclease family protein [Clostridia bacterium]
REELLLPDGGRRPVEYGDFAILLRTVSHTAPTFERALREAGIPVTNRNEGDRFFDLFEVQSILSYLLVLNNPYDDVALVSLLYGDYFRFTVGELAGMRHRYTPLYEDLKKAAETLPKAKRAYETIEGYRKLAGTLYVYDLLYRIYQESGIFGAYAAEEGGAEKCANLELLAEDARLFEQEGYRGLYAFVQHIRISRERTQSGARLQNERNSVQIMSIHKSKGLQFPICILGDCQKKISTADGNEPILLHPRYGAAAEHPEPELYSCLHSLAQTVLADQITADGFSEEERVLYVALTRAESKVLMLINADRKSVENWAMEGASFREIPDWAIRSKGASYGKWLITLLSGAEEGAALRAECALPPLLDAPPLYGEWIQGTLSAQEEQTQATAMPPKPFDREAFRQRLDWVYPHLTAVGLPAKLSVSELKGIREAEEDAQPLLEQQIKNSVPRFAEGNKPRGNDVGNALHQALQFCDFTRLQKNPEEELARLVAEDFISEKQRALIPVEKIRRFTQSDCFEALMSAETYYKEERFLFPMPAAQLFGAQAEGEILIQGVLDCYWVEGDRAVILDYKTDRVQDPQELIDRYRVQMDLYEEALKRVRNLTVIRREIYSFSLEKTIIL